MGENILSMVEISMQTIPQMFLVVSNTNTSSAQCKLIFSQGVFVSMVIATAAQDWLRHSLDAIQVYMALLFIFCASIGCER
ncbi:MAG: hypothetical protein GY928_25025 [Colwellia sp.]|nr:hypothetical protein [Colwellia sp.]